MPHRDAVERHAPRRARRRPFGDLSLPDRFQRREAIPRDAIDAYAQELRDTGQVHEVEARYGELKTALRRLLSR